MSLETFTVRRCCSVCGKKEFGKDVFDYGYVLSCESCNSLVCNWCIGQGTCCTEVERMESYPKGRNFKITK